MYGDSSDVVRCSQCVPAPQGGCKPGPDGFPIPRFDISSGDDSCIRLYEKDQVAADQMIARFCNNKQTGYLTPNCACFNARKLGLVDDRVQKILDDPKNSAWQSQPFAPSVCLLKQCDSPAYLTSQMKQSQQHCPPIIYCTTSNDHINVEHGGTFVENVIQTCGAGSSVTIMDTFWSFVKEYPWVIAAFGIMIFIALVGIGVAIYQVRSGSGSQLSDQQRIMLLMLRKKKEQADRAQLAQQIRQQIAGTP